MEVEKQKGETNNCGYLFVIDDHIDVAASQNARSGSTPKTHRRSRPLIQTSDPDRSRPHDPDL